MKTSKKGLKKLYGYEGNMPVKCHLCGSDDIYAGHNSGTALGVQCLHCGLKLSIPYEMYYVGEHWNSLTSYDCLLLIMAIEVWNKAVSIDDLVVDEWVKCPHCDDWASKITIMNRRNRKKRGYCYHCEKKIDDIDAPEIQQSA